MGKHEILEIKNLECFLVMRSLVSRKFCTEIFNWQWHYYFLLPEGVKFLRTYLGLPESVIPNTHKQDVSKTEVVDDNIEADEERGQNTGRGRGRGNRGGNRGRGRTQQEARA